MCCEYLYLDRHFAGELDNKQRMKGEGASIRRGLPAISLAGHATSLMSNLTYSVQSRRHDKRPLSLSNSEIASHFVPDSREVAKNFRQLPTALTASNIPGGGNLLCDSSRSRHSNTFHTTILPQYHKMEDVLQGAGPVWKLQPIAASFW